MKPVRVLQLVAAPVAAATIGVNGPERRTLRLLDRWPQRGIEPIVAYPRRGRLWEAFRASPAVLVDFEIGSKLRVERIGEIVRLAQRHRSAIIHSQGPASLDAFAVSAARLAGCRAIVTRPSMLEDKIEISRPRRTAYAAIDRCFLRRADRVVAVSEAGWRHLAGVTRVDPGRLALVRNGVDLAHFFGAGHAAVKRSTARTPVVGMAAQMTAPKGWPDFLTLIGALRDQGNSLRAIAIGDGPLRGLLERRARELRLENLVEFAGHVDDVSALLRQLDVFVLCSHREGLSMAVLEAMASGLPIVTTQVGGARELVLDGTNGYVVPAGDVGALARRTGELLRSAEARQRMGRASRERARRLFSESRMADGYAELYHGLAAPRGEAR